MVTEADWQSWTETNFKDYLNVAFEAFGTERLMFGSDWPVCLLAASYDQTILIVENYIGHFSKEAQAKVMGENARRIYNL